MTEIINLAEGNGDDHVYAEAAKIASKKLKNDYSFIIQVWKHEMPEETRYPKVLISTSDEAHNIPKQINDDSFVHIFKQYAPLTTENMLDIQAAGKVTAIPLCHLQGVYNKNIPIKERDHDWSWMGKFDPYTRSHFRGCVDRLSYSRPDYKSKVLWYDGWGNGEDLDSYSDIMNGTKIAPAPVGSSSVESFRFFEAMMCGCVVLNTSLPPTDFYNSAPYIKIDDWHQLTEVVDFLLADLDTMEELSNKAKEWYKNFCSPEAISELIVSKLEGENEN